MPDMGGEGAFIPLPELSAYGLAQDSRGHDPPRIFIQLFKQLELFGGQRERFAVFPYLRAGQIHGGDVYKRQTVE